MEIQRSYKYQKCSLTQLPLELHINQVNIGSDNALSPIRRQAIIWTDAGLLSIGPLRTNFTKLFIHENAFENIVCGMAAILSKER